MPDAKIGKIDLHTFTSFVLPRLGKSDDTGIVPPQTGIDAGVIDIGGDAKECAVRLERRRSQPGADVQVG